MYFNLNIDLFNLGPWSTYLITFAVCLLLGLVLQWLLFILLKILQGKRPTVLKEQLIEKLKLPTKFFLPVLFMYGSLRYFEASTFWHKLVEALIIINIAWILISLINALEAVVKERFSVSGVNKAKDRKALTQLRFIKSISFVVIITLAVAAILWNIPSVKKLGTTILTSAGVIGIIVGVAAQKSIANLITGFQIAFTQPIKIDDEVVIEGEFGTVEDITLTYVIIKLWDWRRLVLPLSYFNENSFINWSFKSKEIIGSVYFYVDYIFPVPELRSKLHEVLDRNELWDHKEVNLLVTNMDSKTMELRATFGAKNASDVWNLRCYVRENLINYIQQFHKDALPKYRKMELEPLSKATV